MPRVPWPEMMDKHPAAHLVVGVLAAKGDARTIDFKDDRLLLDLVLRVAKGLAPAGNYAATLHRNDAGTQVFVALAVSADATKLTSVVQGRPSDEHTGWASQHSFQLDDEEADRLQALPSTAPKRPGRSGPQPC